MGRLDGLFSSKSDEWSTLNHCVGECHECNYNPNNWKVGEQE